jgi:methionine synthase II (cobalamin-independent)
MPTFAERWEAAKNAFETKTGVKKPKPSGFFKNYFNHTNLSKSIVAMDVALQKAEVAKEKDKAGLVEKAKAPVKAVASAVTSYVRTLDDAVDAEYSDKNQKTVLYRELKILKAELKTIAAQGAQKIDGWEVAAGDGTPMEKAGKMANKGLASCCANGVLAVKKVKADPTAATYNALFNLSDSPARKIRAQFVAIAAMKDKGELPNFRQTPKSLLDGLLPWNHVGMHKAVLPDDATQQDVVGRIDEFVVQLKSATDYSAQLKQHLGG